MHITVPKQSIQILLLIAYKFLLDFVFLKVYYYVYAYMTGGTYEWNPVKYLISVSCFCIFLILSYVSLSNKEPIQQVIVTLFMVICIVPMLSVYAFLSSVTVLSVIYPVIFWILMIMCITRRNWMRRRVRIIAIPSIRPASISLLVICVLLGLICWAWAGFPILLSLSDSTATRIALRENSMPTLLSYIFNLLGGVVFPYFFVRFLDGQKRVYAIVSIVVGFLLYSVNGMKTWLFLYAFIGGVFFLCKIMKGDVQKVCGYMVLIICLLLVLCVTIYFIGGGVDLLSQSGRIFCIPNSIGFRSINFFGQEENPYLFLRESILRHFLESPYPGGSDFYMIHGANITTSSGRANNGLWGDAFRNFGIIGILVYPLLISKVLACVMRTVIHKSLRFQIVVAFLTIWNAVNVSFFTWLITGGIVVLLIFSKFFAGEDSRAIRR